MPSKHGWRRWQCPKERKKHIPQIETDGVKTDQNEMNLLTLPLKFMLFKKLEADNMELNLEIAKAKARMERSSNRDFPTEGE